MRLVRAALFALGLSFTLAANASAGVYYTITDLGALTGSNSTALDINNSNQVVGYSDYAANSRRGFLYSGGNMTTLGTLANGDTTARAINNSGQIVGSSYVTNAYRAYVNNGGTLTNLGTLAGDYDSYAQAINNNGQVVGISRDFSYNEHAFLYSGGAMTQLSGLAGYAQTKAYDINNNGQVVGVSYTTTQTTRAFLNDHGTVTDLGTLGGWASDVRGINNNAQIVGSSRTTDGSQHAFLYQGGTMSDLGTLGGGTSFCSDINNHGQVVGTSETAISGIDHSFLYSDGKMTDLKSLVDPASNWTLTHANAINDSGVIVGVGTDESGAISAFQLTPITRTYASLALQSTAQANLRTIRNTNVAGSVSVSIADAGNTTTNYTLSGSSGLTLGTTSGSVAPAVTKSTPVAVRWADTATLGARNEQISLTNTSDPTGDSANHVVNVSGAVVANRVLDVKALGTAIAPVRVLKGGALTTTISSGNDANTDGDDVATRVNTVSGAKIKSGKVTVAYSATQPSGSLISQFNGVNQSANISATFGATGHYVGTIDLAPSTYANSTRTSTKTFLTNGEASAVGATVQSATLAYDVNVLEARKLKAATKRLEFGNVLRGASVSSNFTVSSTNKATDAAHATMVYVAKGGQSIGDLKAQQTLVSTGGSVSVPVSGTFTTYGAQAVTGSLQIATAEDAAVQDTTNYRSLIVQYKANVGIAKAKSAFGSGETVLSASVAAGTTMKNLASEVDPARTLAANSLAASAGINASSFSGKTLYGIVGSEAEIVTSTALATNSAISMQWRTRSQAEAKYKASSASTLPTGAWLCSDVVKINGITSDVSYALQMSFDNRINIALGGAAYYNDLAGQVSKLYLMQFDNSANKWVNAATSGMIGADAEQGVFSSLSSFLATHSSSSLAELQGSWGVDPTTSATGLGHAWAIVAGGGSGVFAVDPTVVPEPSSIALLIAAGVAALGYAWRRSRS
jgi:probable HAF family extracellular repeat protein